MHTDSHSLKDLFLAALAVAAADRAAWLDHTCGADTELRVRIERMLAAHDAPHSLLDAASPPAVPEAATGDAPGAMIGPYKLLEQIGEGGFGVVYMAEQTEPLRRKVALKIVKPGMDTRQVVARFEAERQALALMDHPNIAHVFDGGATAAGRPYFVMELVRGMPITDYCEQNQLAPRQRLELLISVCHAVQHAHQKGIIHRDLKPSNILVMMHDTTPVPKVIDFGIAKALGHAADTLTDKLLFTGFVQMLGTPLYMSPEQAGQSGLDIDTRSDIYSLGVLLYELLTGTTPFRKERFKTAAYEEIRRIIREEDPPRPSTRLSTLQNAETGSTETVSSGARARSAEFRPAHLQELDWIVMKALEKDRNRRYETANGFAADLLRYLADEPVQACPPSAAYRLRKFTRRNKGLVLASSTILLLLMGGITGTTWGLLRAEQARQAEVSQRILAETAAKSERAAKMAEAEQRTRAETALQKAAREAAIAAAINDFLNKDLLQLASPHGQVAGGVSPNANLSLRTVLQRAAKRIEGKFPNEPEVAMRLRYTIGSALAFVGDNTGALPQLEKVVACSQELLGPDHDFTLNAEYRLAGIHKHLGHFDIALRMHEEIVERRKTIFGPAHAQTLRATNGLALTYQAVGRTEEALQVAEQNLELRKRHLGPTHADTLVSMNNVACLYQGQKKFEKALPLFEETLAGMRKKFAPLHPERINTTANLARAYHTAEQIDKAVPLQEAVVQQFKTAYGLDDARTQNHIDRLIAYDVDIGWCDKAAAVLKSIQSGGANRPSHVSEKQPQREKGYLDLIQRVRPVADKYQRELAAKGAEHLDTLAARQAFAAVLRGQNHTTAATYHLKAILDARQRLLGADHLDTHVSRLELGTTRLLHRIYAEAEPLLLESYAGLKQYESENPKAKSRVALALQRLVQLYDRWDKKSIADEWRQKLDEQKKP